VSTATALRGRRIPLAGRVALDAVETGDPAGPPIVFLHGITDSWRSFELALAEMPGDVRAIAVSQRGHGDSERPPTGYRTRDLGDDVAAVLDALGLERAVLVGHSMGSIVARRFAVDHPNRVERLVLVGSFARIGDKPEVGELATVLASLSDPIDPDFVREFQQSTLVAPVPAPFFETVVAESCKVPVHVFRDALAGIVADDVCDDLARIEAPTLIVWGDQDPYGSRADQDTLVGGIPNARLSVYEGVAHNPHWEQPKRFAREIAEFATALA
jgi:pimeloyl-ACP methyl ester carboxylesterase